MNTTIITIDTPGFMVGLSYEKKNKPTQSCTHRKLQMDLARLTWHSLFRGDESQSLENAIELSPKNVICRDM